MLPRLHWADIATIGHWLGVLVLVAGMCMFVPGAVALACGEYASCASFAFGIGVAALAGTLLTMLPRGRLTRRCLLVLVGLAWLAVSLVCAVPIYACHDCSSVLDASFDALSALTTTGISLAADVEHMALSQRLWRVMMTLAGGVSVIVIAIGLRLFSEGGDGSDDGGLTGGTGGSTGGGSTSGGGSSRARRGAGMTRVISLTCSVMGFFLAVATVVLAAACLASGLGPIDALVEGLTLAASALCTSSATPHVSGLVFYHSVVIDALVAVFMLVGATNFALFAFSLRGRRREALRDSEFRFFAVWVLLLAVFVTVAVEGSSCSATFPGLFANVLFPLVSAATTSGISSVYPEQFGTAIDETVLLALALAFMIGACSHSTGGGIKGVRVVMVLKWALHTVKMTVLPRSARVRATYEHFGQKTLDASAATTAMSVTLLYILSAALGTMLFIAHGNGSITSVFEAVAYVTNGGATAGITSASMSTDQKLMAMLLMWMGRVEFTAVLAVVGAVIFSLRPKRIRATISGRGRGSRRGSSRAGESSRDGGSSRADESSRAGESSGRALGNGRAEAVCIFAICALLASTVIAPYAYAATGDLGEAQVEAADIEALADEETYRELTVSELLESTDRLDGESVKFTGEVVGSLVRASDGQVWANVLQGGETIGVLLDADDAEAIDACGSYGVRGTMIVVRGEYHLACSEHACEMEVHATGVTVKQEGHAIERGWSRKALATGAVLFAAAALIAAVRFAYRRFRGRRARPIW